MAEAPTEEPRDEAHRAWVPTPFPQPCPALGERTCRRTQGPAPAPAPRPRRSSRNAGFHRRGETPQDAPARKAPPPGACQHVADDGETLQENETRMTRGGRMSRGGRGSGAHGGGRGGGAALPGGSERTRLRAHTARRHRRPPADAAVTGAHRRREASLWQDVDGWDLGFHATPQNTALLLMVFSHLTRKQLLLTRRPYKQLAVAASPWRPGRRRSRQAAGHLEASGWQELRRTPGQPAPEPTAPPHAEPRGSRGSERGVQAGVRGSGRPSSTPACQETAS